MIQDNRPLELRSMNKHAGFGAVLLLVFLAIGCGDNREATVEDASRSMVSR